MRPSKEDLTVGGGKEVTVAELHGELIQFQVKSPATGLIIIATNNRLR